MATYRFFNNDNFNEKDILKPHIEQTVKRVRSLIKKEKVLVLHDTTSIVVYFLKRNALFCQKLLCFAETETP